MFLVVVFLFWQVIANMEPYRENKDGSKGDKLPNVASGDMVDIVLESGRWVLFLLVASTL